MNLHDISAPPKLQWWVSRDGIRHNIRDMTDQHILNTINFFNRVPSALGSRRIALGQVTNEAQRRGLIP